MKNVSFLPEPLLFGDDFVMLESEDLVLQCNPEGKHIVSNVLGR
jgi:hypothetical protein